MTDTNFAARLVAARKSALLTQQQLSDRASAHVTQIRRYEAGSSQPTLDLLRSLALALNISADSLLFDEDERGPQSQSLRLKLEAVDQFHPRRTTARRRLHRRCTPAPPRQTGPHRPSQLTLSSCPSRRSAALPSLRLQGSQRSPGREQHRAHRPRTCLAMTIPPAHPAQ